MCLGDILHACLSPIIACTKYLCAGAGLAMVFSFGLVGIDLSSDWPIILIILAIILALIWFIIVCLTMEVKDDQENGYRDDEYIDKFLATAGVVQHETQREIIIQNARICEEQLILREYEQNTQVHHRYAIELTESCIQISNFVQDVFYQQIPYALGILVLFVVLVVFLFYFYSLKKIYFMPEGTRIGFIVGLMFGGLAITIVSWGAFYFAGSCLNKIILKAVAGKQELFDYMYMQGFGLIMLAMAVVYFLFIVVYFIFRSMSELEKEQTQEKLLDMGIHCCGYALGIIVAGFVYRESTSILARSIFNSIDGLIKTDKNLSFNNPYISQPTKILYVIQNVLATQVTNILDSAICIAALSVSAFAMLANSEEIAKENITWRTLLSPTIYLCVNCFCAVVIQMMKTIYYTDETVRFTKVNVQLQILFCNIVSLFIFGLMTTLTYLKEFNMKGKDSSESVQKSAITQQTIIYCCILGQFTNLALLGLVEWLTSHGCQPVRNMALSSCERVPTQSSNFSSYLGNVGQIFVVLTLGILIAAAHGLAGYAGLLAAGCGFLINIMIIVPIYFIGSQSADAYKLCLAAHVQQGITDRIYRVSWAARNYMIYLKITNGGSAVLLALVYMGCSLYLMKEETNPTYDFIGIFGVLYGFMVMYLVKGLTIGSIVTISKEFYLNIYESGVAAEIAKSNTEQLDNYRLTKVLQSLVWTISIFVVDTIALLGFGYFFGKRGTPGLLIGIVLISLIQIFTSIIQGTSIKNSRFYIESDDKVNKKSKTYHAYVYADMESTVQQESTAIPLIVYLLYNTIVIVALFPLFGGVGDLFGAAAPAASG